MTRIRDVLRDRWHSWEEAMQMLRIRKLEDIDLKDEKGEEDGWEDLDGDELEAPSESARELDQPSKGTRGDQGRATVVA